jgi:hypothetical protein
LAGLSPPYIESELGRLLTIFSESRHSFWATNQNEPKGTFMKNPNLKKFLRVAYGKARTPRGLIVALLASFIMGMGGQKIIQDLSNDKIGKFRLSHGS